MYDRFSRYRDPRGRSTVLHVSYLYVLVKLTRYAYGGPVLLAVRGQGRDTFTQEAQTEPMFNLRDSRPPPHLHVKLNGRRFASYNVCGWCYIVSVDTLSLLLLLWGWLLATPALPLAS